MIIGTLVRARALIEKRYGPPKGVVRSLIQVRCDATLQRVQRDATPRWGAGLQCQDKILSSNIGATRAQGRGRVLLKDERPSWLMAGGPMRCEPGVGVAHLPKDVFQTVNIASVRCPLDCGPRIFIINLHTRELSRGVD